MKLDRSQIRSTARGVGLAALSTALRMSRYEEKLTSARATHMLYLHSSSSKEWFSGLVSYLDERFDLIDFEEAANRVTTGAHPRASVAFSFDDGFASNRNAGEELARRSISAAFFVCTDLVGSTPDQVTRFFGRPQPEPVLDWDDLEFLKSLGHEIGSHTKTHPNLASLSEEKFMEEIAESSHVLSERFDSCRHFAWPFGRARHITGDQLERLLDGAEYTSISSAVRGSHSSDPTEVLFRHVVQAGQEYQRVIDLMSLSALGCDNHRAERRELSGHNKTARGNQ